MIPLVSDTHILFQMPPKKKFKDTRSSSEVFLLGQPSPTPVTMTKPLTNVDMVRYLQYMKSLECNKSASWEMLSSCPQIKGTAEANCGIKGYQFSGGEDLCGVIFANLTGGWIITGLPLKSDNSSIML